MKNSINLELKEFLSPEKTILVALLKKTVYIHSLSGKVANKEEYSNEIKNGFIAILSEIILNKLADVEAAKEILNAKIYSGKIETLLQRISQAIYRRYVEHKDKDAQVMINKRNLNKLNVSQAKLIRYTNKVAPLINDLMEIKAWHDEEIIVLEFSLIL